MIINSIKLKSLDSERIICNKDHFSDTDSLRILFIDILSFCSQVHSCISIFVSLEDDSYAADVEFAFTSAVEAFCDKFRVELVSMNSRHHQSISYEIVDGGLSFFITLPQILIQTTPSTIESIYSSKIDDLVLAIYKNILASKECIYQNRIQIIDDMFTMSQITEALDDKVINWRDHLSFEIDNSAISLEYTKCLDRVYYLPSQAYASFYDSPFDISVFDSVKLNYRLNLVPYPIKATPLICTNNQCRSCSLHAHSLSGIYKQCTYCSVIGTPQILTNKDKPFSLPYSILKEAHAIVSLNLPHPKARIKILSSDEIVRYFVDFEAPQGFIDVHQMPPCFHLPISFKVNEDNHVHPFSMAPLQLMKDCAHHYDIMVHINGDTDIIVPYLEKLQSSTGLSVAIIVHKEVKTSLNYYRIVPDHRAIFSLPAEHVSSEHLAFLKLLEKVHGVSSGTFIDRYNHYRRLPETQYNFSLLFLTKMKSSFDDVNKDVIALAYQSDEAVQAAVALSGWVDIGVQEHKILNFGLKFSMTSTDRLRFIDTAYNNGFSWALAAIFDNENHQKFFEQIKEEGKLTSFLFKYYHDTSVFSGRPDRFLKYIIVKRDIENEAIQALKLFDETETATKELQVEYLRTLIVSGKINRSSMVWKSMPRLGDCYDSLRDTALAFSGEAWMLECLEAIK